MIENHKCLIIIGQIVTNFGDLNDIILKNKNLNRFNQLRFNNIYILVHLCAHKLNHKVTN